MTHSRPLLASMLVLTASLSTGCASTEKPVQERGWVGGELVPVTARSTFQPRPALTPGRLVGLPRAAPSTSAVLLRSTGGEGSAWSRAGLLPGDLIVSAGDSEISDPDDLFDVVRAREPGSALPIRFWRDGDFHDAELPLGTEDYREYGSLRIGFGLSASLDLWPFDDGIDVLGLLVARGGEPTPDTTGPEMDYLRSLAVPDEAGEGEVVVAPVRRWTVFLGILGLGGHDEIVRQADPE